MPPRQKPNLAHIEARARQRAAAQASRDAAKALQAQVDSGVSETVALGENRGEMFDRQTKPTPGRQKPVRRLSGVDWLQRQGKLSERRQRAAVAYCEAYEGAMSVDGLRSCLGEHTPGNGNKPVAYIIASAEARARSIHTLRGLHRAMMHQEDLIVACDLIVGQGKTPREAASNGSQAARLEALVLVALDLIAVSIGA
jgi:hypothetical protein